MKIKDLYKIMIAIAWSLFSVVSVAGLQLLINDNFWAVVLEEIFKIIPVIMLSKTLFGALILGGVSSTVFGGIESILRNMKYGLFGWNALFLHISLGLIDSLGVYACKKRIWFIPIFLLFFFFIVVRVHSFFNVYRSLWMAIQTIWIW